LSQVLEIETYIT
jgi:hypothetical protein